MDPAEDLGRLTVAKDTCLMENPSALGAEASRLLDPICAFAGCDSVLIGVDAEMVGGLGAIIGETVLIR